VFAIWPGDGEATPVGCPGGGDAFAEAALAGEVPGDAAGAAAGELPDDAADAVGGDAPGEDGGLETAAPWAAGDGDSSGAGARAPMFARSWPIRIFPRNTGRSKM